MANRFDIVVDFIDQRTWTEHFRVMGTISGMNQDDRIVDLESELNMGFDPKSWEPPYKVIGYGPADCDVVVSSDNFYQHSEYV